MEILTTVALLSFIILGLVAMFNQTRRAFVGSMTQVDVLGSGRMAADLIAREVEQLAATTPSGMTNAINFLAVANNNYATLVQPLDSPPSGNNNWTNNIQQLYLVTRNNQQWNAVGYKLTGADYANGIGTLYRFSTNSISFTDTNALAAMYNYFNTNDPVAATNCWTRIIDGVVDFRIRTYNMNGMLMTNLNVGASPPDPITIQTNVTTGEYFLQRFMGDALPAYVEIELGVLEDRSLGKYQALTNPVAGPGTIAWGYLTNHAGQVHLFRQRIPIRNVNPAFYP